MAADKMLNIIVRARDEASSQLKNIADKVGSGFDKISNVAGVAAAAIKGFSVKAVSDLADLGESMANVADKTGTSIESINAMRVNAEAMGLSVDTVAGGITKMNVNLASLSGDSKKASDALKPLGLNLKDLKNLSPEDQFFKLGNAIAKIDDPSQRAAASMKLFGKAGVELLPFFAKGTADLEGMKNMASEFGLALDEKAVAAAARADEAFDNLGLALKGAEQQIALALAPAISDLVAKIQPVISVVSEWIEKNPQLFATILEVTTGILGLIFVIPKVIAGVQAVGAAMSFLAANPIGFLIIAIAAVTAGIIYLWTTNEGFRNAIILIWNAIKTFLGIIWDGIKSGLAVFIENIKISWAAWSLLFEILKGVWDRITGFLSEVWANLVASINEGMGQAQAAWDGFWNAMFATVNNIVGQILALIGQITGALNGAVSAAKSALNFVGQAGGAVAGAAGGAWNAAGNYLTGKNAKGGGMHANRSYLVGEHGPEVLTMGSQAGNMTPNSDIGGGINITISGNTLLDSTAAVKIGDMIVQRLRLQRKLA